MIETVFEKGVQEFQTNMERLLRPKRGLSINLRTTILCARTRFLYYNWIVKRHAVPSFGSKRRSVPFLCTTQTGRSFFVTISVKYERPRTMSPPISMEVFQLARLSPEIPFRLTPLPLNFPNRRRISFFRPLSAISDSRSDSGTCRSDSKKQEWEKRGIDLHLFSADSPEWSVLETASDYTHLLISIPPLADIGDPMLRNVDLVRDKLSSGNLRWLCYLSSTSMYGDYGGAWVSEDHPPNPKTQSAKLRLAAEEGWLRLGRDLGISTQILRLGGIYGPGRSAIDTLLKQEHLSEGQKRRASRKYTSRVHVEDICQALQAAIENPSSTGEMYNVVDDDPAPREEVFEYALELIEKRWPGLNIERKPFMYESREESSLRGEKRVRNEQMKKKLGVKLMYPSYKSGLQSIVEKMDNPF